MRLRWEGGVGSTLGFLLWNHGEDSFDTGLSNVLAFTNEGCGGGVLGCEIWKEGGMLRRRGDEDLAVLRIEYLEGLHASLQ